MSISVVISGGLAEEAAEVAWEFNRHMETNADTRSDRLRSTARKLDEIAERAGAVAMVTVNLTRAQRDAVREDLEHVFSGQGSDLGHVLRGEDRVAARETVHRLGVGLRLLDLIGWQEDGDRDQYRLELDADLVEWFRELGDRGRGVLVDDLPHEGDPEFDALIALDRAMIEASECVVGAVA